eukprot:UN34158
MFKHLWITSKSILKIKEKQEHFEKFFEDVLEECLKYGEIEFMNTVQNMGDHMIGNTFVRYVSEEMAENAVNSLKSRFMQDERLCRNYLRSKILNIVVVTIMHVIIVQGVNFVISYIL